MNTDNIVLPPDVPDQPDEDETLLREIYGVLDEWPYDLECTNCHYREGYFFWYRKTGFVGRKIRHCPGCGMRIFGVVTTNG